MQEKIREESFNQALTLCTEYLHESLQTNKNMRMKYDEEKQKFFPSEEAINNVLNILQEKYYETDLNHEKIIDQLVSSKIIGVILKTLQHPNADINATAISLIHALTVDLNKDIEAAEVDEEERERTFGKFFRLSIWMTENGLLECLVECLFNKLNQEDIDQYGIVTKTLKVLELLLDLSNIAQTILISETKIVQFLANRIMPNFTISHRTIDDNKYISSDILITLLQNHDQFNEHSAVEQLFQFSGTEVLIAVLSHYEKQPPTLNDEKQYLSNVFDSLRVLLGGIPGSRTQFLEFKGHYLMISYVCRKGENAIQALKVISSSLDLSEGRDRACEEIVEGGGLRYLFPVLMRQGLKADNVDQQRQIDENNLNILYFLSRWSISTILDRVVQKFYEKRFQKLERLFQLFAEYYNQNERTLNIEPTAQEYLSIVKQQSISIIQILVKTILQLYTIPKLQQKILALLKLYSVTVEQMYKVMVRHYRFIDEGQQKQFIEGLLSERFNKLEQNLEST